MKKYGKYEKRPEGVPAPAPKQSKKMKNALLQTYITSLLCMVLCVTMFFGTSFAWFTSEVTNRGNEIYIGTLDVELAKKTEDADGNETWDSLSSTKADGTNTTKLFDGNIRWEPGYTALETIKVVNEGDLAFNYKLTLTEGGIANAPAGLSEQQALELLKKVAKNFVVYVHSGDFTTNDAKPGKFEDILNSNTWEPVMNGEEVATLADILVNGLPVLTGSMDSTEVRGTAATNPTVPGPSDSKATEDTFVIALHMKEETNDATIMGHIIDLNVKLIAYQKASEQDAFGNSKYDYVEFVSTEKELQDALDNATGKTLITLADDIATDLTITQKQGVETVIDGNGNEFTGSIVIDGKSSAIETAGLTIQNVNFVGLTGEDSVYINLGVAGNNNTRYTNNVTIKNCTFSGTDYQTVAIKSYTGGDKNLTITGCTVNSGMHSLVQIANVDNVLIENCTVNSKNGVNVNQSVNVIIRDCTFVVTGYAVRFGASSGGTGAKETYLIENCVLKSACAEDGDAVIILRGTADNATLTLKNSTLEGTREILNTATNATVVYENN